MRRLIASAIVTLDGHCEGPRGELVRPPWSRELGDESLATLDRCDTLLYGRVGFERARAFWQRADVAEVPMARLLARYPKLVCSTTLHDPGWNARVLRDPIAELSEILRAPGRDIVVFGSPTLLATLWPLVDELRMIVVPQQLPSGRAWLPSEHAGLTLYDTRELAGGAVVRCYRRA